MDAALQSRAEQLASDFAGQETTAEDLNGLMRLMLKSALERMLNTKDISIHWRVEGTEGLARGTIGWPDYPAPTPSTLDFTTTQQPGYWLSPRWKEVWFPDAFIGTMAA